MIEQIYNDFNTKVLPQLAKGLTITQGYFMDLFGRYTKFLIISDASLVAFNLLLLIFFSVFLKKSLERLQEVKDNNRGKNEYRDDGYIAPEISYLRISVSIVAITISLLFTVFKVQDLLKSVFIPELRIYEEYKTYSTRIWTHDKNY